MTFQHNYKHIINFKVAVPSLEVDIHKSILYMVNFEPHPCIYINYGWLWCSDDHHRFIMEAFSIRISQILELLYNKVNPKIWFQMLQGP